MSAPESPQLPQDQEFNADAAMLAEQAATEKLHHWQGDQMAPLDHVADLAKAALEINEAHPDRTPISVDVVANEGEETRLSSARTNGRLTRSYARNANSSRPRTVAQGEAHIQISGQFDGGGTSDLRQRAREIGEERAQTDQEAA